MATGGSPTALRMRIDLDPRALEEPRWPDGVEVRPFTLPDAEALHSLLVAGYRHGGGAVGDLGPWLSEMTTDEEYESALWILAEQDALLVGAILCWTSGFVKDLVVDESWRRRGVGEALMRHVLAIFSRRGHSRVELKVHADNAAAIRLYERVGMRVVERLDD
jgi:ribosomal protein S18 acetylase RimI-like enzyme